MGLEERCGGRGLRVFAARVPAASDLVAIYKDVGAVLITLSTSIVPLFRLSTSVSSGSAIGASFLQINKILIISSLIGY